MILAYAGRLPGTDEFPDDNVDYVGEQIERLVRNLRPRMVIGSAAAGADLLVLEAALMSGAEATVVLAGTAAEFRESSVRSRGERWARTYDTLEERATTIEVPRHDDDADSYASVTKLIVQIAAEAAEDDEPVVGFNVSALREGADHSADLASVLELEGRLVLRLDPARQHQDTPTAFVAMPYGRRGAYEADATYHRILLPALIDGGYRPVRADAEALLEIIDLTMLKRINQAKLLVADLATLNANVMWEVGVRHAWRRSGTVLLRPRGTEPPFDVSHARVHEYEREETTVTDSQAVEGIRLMRSLLDAVGAAHVDSPVFAALPDLPEPELPAESATEVAGQHLEAISLAADLGDTGELLALAERIERDDAEGGPLLEQIGLALIAVERHVDAARILRPLAEADPGMRRIRLQQQYAHALIRSGDEDTGAARLRALLARGGASGETYGLLGSAAKARAEKALAAGEAAGAELDAAIDAYMSGLRSDPGDYYPGIVAVALLRVRGGAGDVELARELLPVVRFAATRHGEPTEEDMWRLATVAELHLHEYLLYPDREDALVQATTVYTRVASAAAPNQRASAKRQLQMLRDAGDPPDMLDALLALFD